MTFVGPITHYIFCSLFFYIYLLDVLEILVQLIRNFTGQVAAPEGIPDIAEISNININQYFSVKILFYNLFDTYHSMLSKQHLFVTDEKFAGALISINKQ